jgi:hypothetical protein
MNDDDPLYKLLDQVEAGTMTFEDTVDLFMLTATGQATGVSRDQVMAKLREHFSDLPALNAYLQSAYSMVTLVRGAKR